MNEYRHLYSRYGSRDLSHQSLAIRILPKKDKITIHQKLFILRSLCRSECHDHSRYFLQYRQYLYLYCRNGCRTCISLFQSPFDSRIPCGCFDSLLNRIYRISVEFGEWRVGQLQIRIFCRKQINSTLNSPLSTLNSKMKGGIAMKKIFKILFGALAVAGISALVLSSCHVKSESQIVKYANQNFGSAELVATETMENGGRKCIMRDKEYGFEYYVKSEMHDINIDGSKFGSTESTGSDFSKKYYELLQNTCQPKFDEIAKSDNIEINDGDSFNFMNIRLTSENNNFLSSAEKIADIIISFDNRKYYKESYLGIYDMNEKRLGAYYIHEKKWVDADDEDDHFYIERAKMLNRNAKFIRKEKKLFKDTGFAPDQVRISLGEKEYTYETPVQYYYFSVDGREFFIADFILKDHYSDIYQYNNYDEVFN